jgi:hypothetical protein
MLDVARRAARRFEPGWFCLCRPFKELGLVTARAGCARIGAIDFGAHEASLMTTSARQDLIARVHVLNAGDPWNCPNTMNVNSVKLGISPLLNLTLIGPVTF